MHRPVDASRRNLATGGFRRIMTRWYVLIAMALVYTLSIADRYVISTLLEPIRLELQLSDSGIALLTGVSLAILYVFVSLPMGWLIDRGNRRYIVALSVIVWSVMTSLCGLSRTYAQLLFGRMGVGFAEAAGTPGANSLLSDYFPPARRPIALTIFSLGAPLGAWLGASFAGSIADHYGWRAAFVALGIPGVLFGFVILLTIREPQRGRFDGEPATAAAPGFMATVAFLWEQRAARHILAGGTLTALWGWGLMWWTPAFLMRTYFLSAGEAAAVTGPIHLIGGIGATVATAWWLARPSMLVASRIVRFMSVGIALGTFASAGIYLTHNLALAQVLFWIFIPTIYFYIGPGFGVFNNLAPSRMRGVFCAILLFATNVSNLIIAPQMIGLLSDAFAPAHVASAESLRAALLCLIPVGFWAAYHFWISARTIETDESRARNSVRQ